MGPATKSMKVFLILILAFGFITTLVHNLPAQTDPVERFYRGKTIRFITGYSAGGIFDNATRVFSRHVGRYIPGHPNVWVDNMTGAGGMIATDHVYNNSPRDGTVMLNLDGALLRAQALGTDAVKFDGRRFNWLPSPGPDLQVCWVTRASGWTSLAEAAGSAKELKLGGLGPGTFPSDNARLLQSALGLKLKLVDGYKGVSDVRLAAESGEIDGSCSSLEGVRRSFPEQLKSGEIKLIGQVDEKPWPGIEQVPNALDLAKTDRGKRLLRIGIIGPNDINRLFTLPPAVPPERVEALRKAFTATFNDAEFKAEVEKSRMVLRMIPVERIKEVVSLWLEMPDKDKKELQQILTIK
jgi:tripartite-type tricarboxylate transporter receptor subunit TctC